MRRLKIILDRVDNSILNLESFDSFKREVDKAYGEIENVVFRGKNNPQP